MLLWFEKWSSTVFIIFSLYFNIVFTSILIALQTIIGKNFPNIDKTVNIYTYIFIYMCIYIGLVIYQSYIYSIISGYNKRKSYIKFLVIHILAGFPIFIYGVCVAMVTGSIIFNIPIDL